MNACPNDGVLLQFLDGKLNADNDARVLAHVENCAGCQQHLERLTKGLPVAEVRPPDRDGANRRRLQRSIRNPPRSSGAMSRKCQPTANSGRAVRMACRIMVRAPGRLSVPPPTAEFSLSPVANQGASTNGAQRRQCIPSGRLGPDGQLFRSRSGASSRSDTSQLPRTGPPSPATTSSSGWAKGAWGSSTRRGTAGSTAWSP